VEEPGPHHERIGRHDVDELRSRRVGRGRDRDEKLAVLGLTLDDQDVALADREGGLDDRVGVARERVGRKKAVGRQLRPASERFVDSVGDGEVAIEAGDFERTAGLEAGRGEVEPLAVSEP
jgi:hypothetical protein